MMKIKAIAIDDEPLALEVIKFYCTQCSAIELIQTFDNATAGLEYINQNDADLLLVDIDMPDMDGITLVKNIQIKPMVIFTTAYKQYALEGFELEAVDYLLKPFSFERFDKAVQKVLFQIRAQAVSGKATYLFVYSEYRMAKIDFGNIIYIESLDDYIKIHLVDAKPILTLMTLKKISEILPKDQFFRIHRSYIVAIKSIVSVSGRKIILTNQLTLPVSEKYASSLTSWTKKA